MLTEMIKQSDRWTGIDILGDVPWGTHFCLFYKTKEDLLDILVPYFQAGLESNEFCMWITSELSVEEAEEALKKHIPEFDRYKEKGQIQIIPYSDWYLEDGVFNLQKVLHAWMVQLNQALANGYAGMRVTGNTAWLEVKDWACFADYERQVSIAGSKYRMIAICTYFLDKCGASEIIDVASSHESALIRREGKWTLIEKSDLKEVKGKLHKSEEELHNLNRNLEERVKELNCLYGISKIVEKPGVSLDEILLGTVNIVPASWQYPEITCARVSVNGRQFTTPNFEQTEWKQTSYILVHNEKVGTLEVCYLQQRPESYEGPFLLGERELIDVITKRLGRIIERIQDKELLQSSENKYRTVLENLPQKIFLKDKNSVYVSCNDNYAKDLKIKAQEIVGKTDYDFFPKELAEKYRADDKRIMISGKTEDINERYIRFGKEVVIHTVKAPLRDGEGNATGIIGIFWDITAQRRAQRRLLAYQKRLRDLASEMSLTEERERKRIAIELHDQVTQNLILFKINLGGLREKNLPGELNKPLDEIYKHLDQIIDDMRSLIFDLGSPTLYELGLEAAIREYLNEKIQQKHGIETEFADDAMPMPLDDDVRALLYRAVRELLINIVKHAKAQHAKISIWKDDNNICIKVADDGIGFQQSIEELSSGKTAGFGLFSIHERLSYLGGSIEIESKLGAGTQVTLVAPIRN
jgi:PAS domain S-box-containing protein